MKDTTIDVKDDGSPASSDSHDNDNRVELMWESREEDVIHNWMAVAKNKEIYHNDKGKTYKNMYAVFALPAMLIPIVISGVGTELDPFPLVRSAVLILSGCIAGVSAFFNFGSKMSRHFEYEGLYGQFYAELQVELSKPKANRIQCDVFLQKYLDRFNLLNNSAPV